MTPIQVAKAHCANFTAGKCLLKGACVIASERCTYFDECVAPMAATGSWPGVTNSRELQELADAVKQYKSLHSATGQRGRLCPQCNEHELERSKRLCHECRVRQRKLTYRRANQQRVRSTTEVAKNARVSG